MAFIAKAILMSILPFYRTDFPVDLVPNELYYVEHNKGRDTGTRVLTEKEHAALKEIFLKNKHGWRYDLTSYAPRHLFTSSSMKINCLDGGTVFVNYADTNKKKKDRWTQISRADLSDACPRLMSLLSEGKPFNDRKRMP